MSDREITLRYFDGCPNWQVARKRIEQALDQLGETGRVTLEQIESPERADEVQFRGSPTTLIDGKDRFDAAGPTGLSCRVYETEAGLQGAPSVEQLVAVIEETS